MFKIPPSFQNTLYKSLRINYDNFFDLVRVEDNDLPIERKILRVSFELSNLCSYSFFHKKCPVSGYREKRILPSEIIYNTLDELALFGFEGVIAFHRYNEPLIDPRLFKFIEYTNTKIPAAKILILTNGFYLTQEMLNEFFQYKIWIIAVSSYTLNEHNRLINLKAKMPYYVFFSVLDDRKSIYDNENVNSNKSCYALLRDLTINCQGQVNLCCLDFENRFNFGDLYNNSLQSILNSEKFIRCCKDLIGGNRCLEICKRCTWSR
jgi:hypothetical protein